MYSIGIVKILYINSQTDRIHPVATVQTPARCYCSDTNFAGPLHAQIVCLTVLFDLHILNLSSFVFLAQEVVGEQECPQSHLYRQLLL